MTCDPELIKPLLKLVIIYAERDAANMQHTHLVWKQRHCKPHASGRSIRNLSHRAYSSNDPEPNEKSSVFVNGTCAKLTLMLSFKMSNSCSTLQLTLYTSKELSTQRKPLILWEIKLGAQELCWRLNMVLYFNHKASQLASLCSCLFLYFIHSFFCGQGPWWWQS